MNGKNFNHSKIMVVFAVREGRFFCLYNQILSVEGEMK